MEDLCCSIMNSNLRVFYDHVVFEERGARPHLSQPCENDKLLFKAAAKILYIDQFRHTGRNNFSSFHLFFLHKHRYQTVASELQQLNMLKQVITKKDI